MCRWERRCWAGWWTPWVVLWTIWDPFAAWNAARWNGKPPGIIGRAPVTVPLQTGMKVVDALVPIGRGQRELILGDRQTGKTAIVLDTLINQRDRDVICVYCAIGQRDSGMAQLIANLREQEVMDLCIVVVALGEALPGLHFASPYAATSMAEYFMEQGRDVLIIYDNLTNHARSYRGVSLLLGVLPAGRPIREISFIFIPGSWSAPPTCGPSTAAAR